MKIAQVAPLYEDVPPKRYGGTERIVSYLTEKLVELGHEVTLYATGESRTKAKLRPLCRRALRLQHHNADPLADHTLLIERVFQDASDYDFIHSHIDYLPFPVFRRMETPHVTTLHGRLDIRNLIPLYREFKDMPLVSISNYQRLPLNGVNWLSTVYHGLPADLFTFQKNPGKYLAFIGRISPEKRVDDAIEIARRVGMPIKIAAKVDRSNQEYFDEEIKPLLNDANVEFLGEIGGSDKDRFIGNAYALLFLIDWPEPFGLVMIEAMACGTPVIARCFGAVPEVMEHGTTGFVVRDLNAAVRAVKKVSELDRARCRQVFEERFTSERMTRDYLKIYQSLINRKEEISYIGRKRFYG